MKRSIFLFILIFSAFVIAQESKFVVLSDINFSGKKSEARLDSIINIVNSVDSLDFVVFAGNISKNGKSDEINSFYSIIQNLSFETFVIPGPSDLSHSDNGAIIFNEIWQDIMFSKVIGNKKYLLFNTSVINGSEIGHISPETMSWINEEISVSENENLVFIFYHHPKNINNFEDFLKIIPNEKSVSFISAESFETKEKLSIPFYNKINFKNKPVWQISNVTVDSNKIFINEITSDSSVTEQAKISFEKLTNKNEIDSVQVELFSAESIWGRNISETMIAEPLIFNNKIITATYSGIVTCFDSSGTVLWDFDAFGNITSKPAVVDNVVILATLQGDLITIKAEDGAQLQSIGFDESITSELEIFEYTGRKQLMTLAEGVSKNAVIFGTSSGKLYCYLVETLEEIWINDKSRAAITSKPLLNKTRIVYSSWDGRIYCVDSRDGLMIWRYKMTKDPKNSPAKCFPVADYKFVYFTSPDGKLIKLDIRLGSKIWVKEKYHAYSSIGLSDDGKKVFVKSTNGRFHIISARNGNWVREIIPRFGKDFSRSYLNEKNGIIPFAVDNGDVYRVNKKYYYKKLLNLGSCEPHSVQPFIDDSWIISNKDGKIVRFNIK